MDGMAWHGMVWCGVVWYGTVQYGTVWYAWCNMHGINGAKLDQLRHLRN